METTHFSFPSMPFSNVIIALIDLISATASRAHDEAVNLSKNVSV
jgi:hypothetical protein